MIGTPTMYDSVQRNGQDLPQIIHTIGQFSWFRDGMARTARRDKEVPEAKVKSAVRFILPYTLGGVQSYVVCTGNGLNQMNVYFATLNWGRDRVTGAVPTRSSALFRLFGNKGMSFGGKSAFDFPEVPEEMVELHRIFMTNIKPFLKGGDYPLECDRVYDVYLMHAVPGCDKIRFIAENREDRQKQRFRVIWTPDPRDGKPEEVICLEDALHDTPPGDWISEGLKTRRPISNFTFPSAVNCG